mmetsp:Transcript_27037/g.54493  ORF Transcript_27037/g.54493 Transcript_27037/m.54493 type:complete len:308 (-) Transcript_27037:255-1178(-)
MWIVELLSGIALWLAAVIGFPLLLSAIFYCYIEGAPEVLVFVRRVFGNFFRIIAMGIRDVLDELASITLVPYLLKIIPYLLGIAVLYFAISGNSSAAFIVAMFAAAIDSFKKEWTRLVFFVWLGVTVLVLQVVDPYSPVLTLLMWLVPSALAASTATALGMMGTSRGRENSSRGQSGSRRHEGRDGVLGLSSLKTLFSGRFSDMESDAVLPMVRPLLFLLAAAYLVLKSHLSWAFVVCLIAAIVEITNEKWFHTAAFAGLGVTVLVLESAPIESSALVSAIMIISPLAVAGIAVNDPKSRTARDQQN